jgi:hypothetical protein
MDSDLARLSAAYPDWQITSVWASACSGPDARRLMAYRYTGHRRVLLTAWTAAELSTRISEEDRATDRD